MSARFGPHLSALILIHTCHGRAILQQCIPLVPQHGFTRKTIALAAVQLPNLKAELSDTAISALFGRGDEARRSLIHGWLDEGAADMRSCSPEKDSLNVDILLRSLLGASCLLKNATKKPRYVYSALGASGLHYYPI